MIAVDTSVIIPYLNEDAYPETETLDRLVIDQAAWIAPVTLTELMSSPRNATRLAMILPRLNILPLADGYWERAGLLRARLFAQGRRARLGDALIAQSCLDADAALLTRDEDFAAFEPLAGLKRA